MSFTDDMKLDPRDLDRAALDQPSIYAYWGEEWAKAVLKRDKFKQQLSEKKAELLKKIRENPSKFGWDKDKTPAENWINSIVEFHPSIQELEAQMPDFQYEVNMMQIAKDDCEHRLKSLGILTELYKGNYFAASSRGAECHITAVENAQNRQREEISNHPKIVELSKKKKLTKK
jgi:hypothetical protein